MPLYSRSVLSGQGGSAKPYPVTAHSTKCINLPWRHHRWHFWLLFLNNAHDFNLPLAATSNVNNQCHQSCCRLLHLCLILQTLKKAKKTHLHLCQKFGSRFLGQYQPSHTSDAPPSTQLIRTDNFDAIWLTGKLKMTLFTDLLLKHSWNLPVYPSLAFG